MIQKEFFETREDGTDLIRTYSDEGLMIRQLETGILYSEAIDPIDNVRDYEEVDINIEDEESIEEEVII